MDNKEKYYNFIVGDLLKKTDIDHKQGIIKFRPFSHPLFPFPYRPHPRTKEYIITRYGVLDEEIEIIWYLYRDRIEDIVRNHG